ncbi:MAG TPA: hypothetical protein VLA47_05590 [Nitrospira sp.]|nr:hypothetical protein [Nitrospira sp.]
MSDHDLEKLLGGFAADQLTAEEKQRLYSAALQDQRLFDALADEQALKDLLADPVVRRRLVQALNQPGASGAGSSVGWLDWFRHPAGLAWAGGLAAAVVAVVLGTKIYQDSLKQAAESVVTEEAKPAAPPLQAPNPPQPTTAPIAESPARAQDKLAPAVAPPTKDRLLDKKVARENSAAISPPHSQRDADAAHDQISTQAEQDAARMPADTSVPAIGKTSEKPAASTTEQTTATPSAASPSTPSRQQLPVTGAITSGAAPVVSARSLYYGEAGRADIQEAERPMAPRAQSAPEAGRLERKREQVAAAREQTAGLIQQVKPLGLRYSFVVRGADGRDREIAAAKQLELMRLTFETNQDSYIQIWTAVASSSPRLVFPEQESGQNSFRMVAGQRRSIPLPEDAGTVTIRLARPPFDSLTEQETAIPDQRSPHQLRETTIAGGTPGSQESATYVVNQDPSLAQLSVRIHIGTQ